MRRHRITKRDYERVLAAVKDAVQAAEGAQEEEKEAEPVAGRGVKLPPGALPKIGWSKLGPFKIEKVAHGREVLFAQEDDAFKRLVHEAEIDGYLRDAMLTPGSVVPLARDTGYHIVQKNTLGISRRAVAAFTKKQEVVQLMHQQLPRMKVVGRPLEARGYLELDLVEAKGADIGKWVHHAVRNFYFVVMIDRLTGWIEVERSTKKEAKKIAPIVRRMIGNFAKALGTNVKYIRSDAGSEFKADTQDVFKELKVRSKFVKSGNRVEQANRVYQRIWYQLMRLGRGDLADLTSQAVGIFNNTKSSINGYTPLEALKVPDAELKTKFNESRRKVAKYKAVAIVKGDKVRFLLEKVVGKHKEGLAYKSYRGKHWSPEVHTVVNINTTTGKYYAAGSWRGRDKLLKVPGVDAETKRQVDARHAEILARKRAKIGDMALS